jgi:hypothetical protein
MSTAIDLNLSFAEIRRALRQPLADSTIAYRGSAMGVDSTTGRVRPLVAGDDFAGFSTARADNRTFSTGADPLLAQLVVEGLVELTVDGAVATSLGGTVYADDDNTFTLTSSGGSIVGTVQQFVSAGVAVVAFNALAVGYVVATESDSGGVAVPQFAAELPARGYQPYIASATGTVLAAPGVFGWIRCLTAGTITGLYDAVSATGTNLMPAKAMTANEVFGFLDEADCNDDEGALFDVGVHLVLASGTYEVWLRPEVSTAEPNVQTVRAWAKFAVTADGTPDGLNSPCRLRGIYCLTNGTIAAVHDGAGSAIGTNLLPALAMTANTKHRFGRRGGRTMSSGVFIDITGGTYLVFGNAGL